MCFKTASIRVGVTQGANLRKHELNKQKPRKRAKTPHPHHLCLASHQQIVDTPPNHVLAQHKGHFIQTCAYYAPTHSQTQTNPHVTTNTVGRLDTHTLPSYNKSIKQNSGGPGGNDGSGTRKGTGDRRGPCFRGETVSGGDWLGVENFLRFGAQKKGGPAQPGVGFPGRWPGFFRGG